MPSIRQRVGRALLGEEIGRLESSFNLLREAYLDGPWQLPPEELIKQLGEQESAILYDLVTQLEYEIIGGLGSMYAADTEAQRRRAIDESRRLWQYAPLSQWTVWLWTNYGMGEKIDIKAENSAAQKVWDEFWMAERNEAVLAQDRIHDLSNWALIDGNVFLVFYVDKLTGTSTVRELTLDEITEIITHPDDSSRPLLYKRHFTQGTSTQTWYYPDWRASLDGILDEPVVDPLTGDTITLAEELLPANSVRADLVEENTDVVVMHIAYNKKIKGSLWGWPLLGTAAPYIRSHQQFMRDRLTVAASKAMYVRKAKVQGGSRAVDAVRNTLRSSLATGSGFVDTNPPAVAGSTLVENTAVDTTDFPMTTGASDAKSDGEMFAWIALISGGVFPHYAGMGDAYRLATAVSMEGPILRQWSRYQLFWSSQFKRMVRIVLSFYSLYKGQTFVSMDAEVSTDRLVEMDLPKISESMSRLFKDTVQPYVELGIIPDEVVSVMLAGLWRLVLQSLGVADADKVANEKTFSAPEEPEGTEPPKTDEPEDREVEESHIPEVVYRPCPMCMGETSLRFPDHKGLLVCSSCRQTWDPEVE
jgi:hypothetical protein